MHPEHAEARGQNRDDALHQGQSRSRDYCIIIDNEA